MIRRARRDGREARGNEEREKREDLERKPLFLQVLKLELKHQNLVYTRLLLKTECHGMKQNAKLCAIYDQNVMKIEVFI